MPAKKGTGNFASVIDAEISKLQTQINALEKMKADYARITGGTVSALIPSAPAAPAKAGKRSRKGRKMSPEARARLAEVATARWAAVKQAGVKNLKAAAQKGKKAAKKAAK